jgi:hypothetical protein
MAQDINKDLEQFCTRYRVFKESSIFEELISEVKSFVDANYTEDNLSKRVAYLSDKSDARESYGFIVAHSVETPKLQHITTRKYPMIQTITDSIFQMLDVDCRSRLLFNVQIYKSGSKPVPRHFDGDLFDFTVNPDSTLTIREAIRPKKVAVLTVINDVIGGGTRLYKDDISDVVSCDPGDLLIFDNVACDHGVDSFQSRAGREDGIVRMIIGWRSVEESCVYYEDGLMRDLSFSNALDVQEEFLTSRWPKQWQVIKDQNKLAAF